MKILSWNVNGIRAIHRKKAFDWVKKEDPDIICFQEVKATEEQVPAPIKEMEGYYSYFISGETKGYSGVGIMTKKKPLNIVEGINIKQFDIEARTIMVEYDDFKLFNAYFPNGVSRPERLAYKMEFYKEFLKLINEMREKGDKLIICGDVNTAHKEIDLSRPKENSDRSGFLPMEREWIDQLLESGFIDTFRMYHEEGGNYSWWDYKTRARERNVGWRIDYFFISENLKGSMNDSYMLKDIMGSDHCPIGIKIFE